MKGRRPVSEEECSKDHQVGGDGCEVEEEEEERDDLLSCFRGLVLDVSYRPVNVVCWKRAICFEFMEKADVLEYYDQTVSSPRGSLYIPAVLRVPNLLQVIKRRRIKYNLSRKGVFYRDGYVCHTLLMQLWLLSALERNGDPMKHQFKHNRADGTRIFESFYTCWILNMSKLYSSFSVRVGFHGSMMPNFRDRYCSSRDNLTIDHVIPISRGGEWKWENLVTACARCNSRKGQKKVKEAKMKLSKIPKVPKDHYILAIPLTSSVMKTLRTCKGIPEEWLQYLSRLSP